jgi:hypothetical protein
VTSQASLIKFSDLYHTGIVVEDVDAAKAEYTDLTGVTWGPEGEVEMPVCFPDGATTVSFRFAYTTQTDECCPAAEAQGSCTLGGPRCARRDIDGEPLVGRVDGENFAVDRMLPELPLVADMNEIFDPTPPVRATLVERLTAELARRGQAVPAMPATPPWAMQT